MVLHRSLIALALVGGLAQAQEIPPKAPAPGAKAQARSAKTQEDLDELMLLMNVEIVSVSKVAQRPIDAPGVVAAIPREQLRDYGWVSLHEVLSAQPGFVPSQDYDRRTISARGVFEGWNNNHILVLVDGLPFNDNVYGTAYTWEISPLFFARSLEIMRGPGSALYGSNAVNGVASVNTVKAEDVQGGGEGRIRLGERGTQMLDALTATTGDRFSLVAAYSHRATQGSEYRSLDGSGRTDGAGDPLAFRTRDNRSSGYFFAKVDGLYDLDGWSFQVHQQRWSFETGHGWLFYIPDQPESMKEERRIAVLKYAKEKDGLTQEYALRYQWHGIDWNQRYYPNDTVYTQGLTEYLNTSADELFGRAQLTWIWRGDASLVAGFEGTRFGYDGDKAHFATVDVNNPGGTYAPAPDGRPLPLRPFLEWTAGHPVVRTALYAQVATGKVLGGHVSATLGLRYDKQSSDFNALDQGTPGGPHPTEKLDYSQTSPRLGLLFHRTGNHTLKLLVGRAFRTPAPSETFGANTYALASNIRQLQPELADTVELASDWILSRNLNWRLNLYEAKLKNLIAYSVANANLSTNLYTLKTRGVETELLWQAGPWSGFLNASRSQRVDETILDPTIAPSDEVTWMPSLTANAGATYRTATWTASASLHHQGGAKRRTSDLAPALDAYRPTTVGAFTRADLRFAWRPSPRLELELGASNAFDQKGAYAKNFQYPFDYRIDPRTVWVGLRIN